MPIKIVSSDDPIVRQIDKFITDDIPSAFEKIAAIANRKNMIYGFTSSNLAKARISGFFNDTAILTYHFEKRRKNKKTQTRAHTIVNGYLIDRHTSLQINFKQHQRHFTLSITIPFDLKIKH